MKRRTKNDRAPKQVKQLGVARSIRKLLKPPLTRSQVKEQILEKIEKLGLQTPEHLWRLATWYTSFINAPDIVTLRAFVDDAEFLASTKGGGSLREKITDLDVVNIRDEVKSVIGWAIVEKGNIKGMSTAPLDPIPTQLLLHRVGTRFEKGSFAEDFRGSFLLRLFDLLAEKIFPFAQCEICQRIYARRGRRLYCGPSCAESTRPKEKRKKYLRDYMRGRRASFRDTRK
jgi:hypothetical protein